jgi:hypothetical protein
VVLPESRDLKELKMRIHSLPQTHRVAIICTLVGGLALGISGCGASSKKATSSSTSSTGQSTAKSASNADGGSSIPGLPTDALCSKLPVADAQALILPKLSAAVADNRLGGCTFVLPGEPINGSNLTVVFETGSGAAGRFKDDTNGTFSAGGQSVNVGDAVTTSLSGVGDKAAWGATAGYPMISALKGSVYCSVSTADDATKLTIVGGANNPLPQGTQAQQLQYAQLEGKLCNDLFGIVH